MEFAEIVLELLAIIIQNQWRKAKLPELENYKPFYLFWREKSQKPDSLLEELQKRDFKFELPSQLAKQSVCNLLQRHVKHGDKQQN